METKELKVKVPEGYEIDKENSTFECIKFKPKRLTYDDVAKELFADKCYYIGLDGGINLCNVDITKPNRGTSTKQLKKLLAINKLMNVAEYLNKGWKPNWSDRNEPKYYIYLDVIIYSGNTYATFIKIDFTISKNRSLVYFKTEEFAKKAVEILGGEIISLASTTDW